MVLQLKSTHPVTDDADQSVLFFHTWKDGVGKVMCWWWVAKKALHKQAGGGIQQSEGTSDRRMFRWLLRLKQSSSAGCVFFKCVRNAPVEREALAVVGEDLGGFLGNSAGCAGKQMLPTIARAEKKLMLYSDSIHSSPRPKPPSSEVITQEALAARQTQSRALRCGHGDGAMWASEQY